MMLSFGFYCKVFASIFNKWITFVFSQNRGWNVLFIKPCLALNFLVFLFKTVCVASFKCASSCSYAWVQDEIQSPALHLCLFTQTWCFIHPSWRTNCALIKPTGAIRTVMIKDFPISRPSNYSTPNLDKILFLFLSPWSSFGAFVPHTCSCEESSPSLVIVATEQQDLRRDTHAGFDLANKQQVNRPFKARLKPSLSRCSALNSVPPGNGTWGDMDHCTATFPVRISHGANKKPVLHGMIITHSVSKLQDESLLLSANTNNSNGADSCCACLRAFIHQPVVMTTKNFISMQHKTTLLSASFRAVSLSN